MKGLHFISVRRLIVFLVAMTFFVFSALTANALVPPVSSGNLIQNPGAESGAAASPPSTVATNVPNWTRTGNFTVYSYDEAAITPWWPGLTHRGLNFFAGGPNNPSSTAYQDLTCPGLESGTVTYNLSGWLGGITTQGDNMRVTATFRDASNATLGTATIGPVTAANRGSLTTMLFRTTNGTVPANTRSVRVLMTATRDPVNGVIENNGFADDLNFSVTSPGLAATTTSIATCTPNPSTVGQSVSCTATINECYTPTPGGTMTFNSDGAPIADCTSLAVTGNTVQCTTNALTAGSHNITAAYSGDANFAASTGSMTGNPQVVLDTTPPVISYTLTPASPDGANGWYKSNVTLVWSVSDPESAVTKTGCVDQNITADQDATTYSCSATSAGGSSGPVNATIKRDATAPTITFVSPSTTPWYNANVTANWSCTDSGSGVVSASVSAPTSGEGASVPATGICTDNAGNTASNTQNFKVDKTAPTISASAKKADNTPYIADTWTNQSVTVHFSCGDGAGSGIASCPSDVTYNTDGTFTANGSATDNAGNSASTSFGPVKIDKTAPTLVCSIKPNVLWPPNHKMEQVNASVTVTDPLSGSAQFTLLAVSSNEPDNGLGDGDTENDIQGFFIGTADTSGQLRAERSGTGTGRVYTLNYRGMDKAGNAGTCSVTVTVPHDMGNGQ